MSELQGDFTRMEQARQEALARKDEDVVARHKAQVADVDGFKASQPAYMLPPDELVDYRGMIGAGTVVDPGQPLENKWLKEGAFTVGGHDAATGARITDEPYNSANLDPSKFGQIIEAFKSKAGEYFSPGPESDSFIENSRQELEGVGNVAQDTARGVQQGVQNVVTDNVPSPNPLRWIEYLFDPEGSPPTLTDDIPQIPPAVEGNPWGDLMAGIGQFMAGYGPATRIAKTAAAPSTLTGPLGKMFADVGREAARGAIAEPLAFDPKDGTLSTVLREFGVDNVITQALDSAAEGKTWGEAKLAQAIEGGSIDAVAGLGAGIVATLKHMSADDLADVLGQLAGRPITGDPHSQLGMVAYHGTGAPPFEKFSLDYMGTGEGAQAYGWGLYFAEDPKVAGTYNTARTEATIPGAHGNSQYLV